MNITVTFHHKAFENSDNERLLAKCKELEMHETPGDLGGSQWCYMVGTVNQAQLRQIVEALQP
jgi:hypothetical protein